jgi:hypothetical protein
MPTIKFKNERRYRVQISMQKPLWDAYQFNLTLAKKINAEIDFAKEFEPWFLKQNQSLKIELEKLVAETDVKKVPRLTTTGGDNHGND